MCVPGFLLNEPVVNPTTGSLSKKPSREKGGGGGERLHFRHTRQHRMKPLVEFVWLVFTRMPGDSYRRRLRSLLRFCDFLRALINSLVC